MSNNTSPHGDGPSIHSDHNQGPARKKMRKGTKSCLECRRRKIKCTFEPGRTAICNECYARGSTCIDQEHGDIQSYTQHATEQSSYSLRERVTQLEDLVKQVLNRIPENNGQNGDPNSFGSVDTQAAEVLKSLKSNIAGLASATEEPISLPGGLRDNAPALSLFDNEVIETKQSDPVISRAQYNKSKALIAALTQLLPPPHDLEIILSASTEWWMIWRKMFPEITDSRCSTMKEAVSHSLRSEKPAEIGKIMLCIAISIHQMPDGFDWSRMHLKEDRLEMMERYINTVERLIICDNEISATIDGIECMLLSAKYQINMGRPRRAWLLYHRAVAFCQLLGYHRLASQPDKTGQEYKRQVSCWSHVMMGDRYLAIILGLPYSVSEAFVTPYVPSRNNPNTPNLTYNDSESYVARMLPIMTKMVDRNQSIIPMGYSATLQMDQELEELHNSMKPSWWAFEQEPGLSNEDFFDRLQAQFFHHHARVFLHMPFMLRSSADKRYQYSHTAALDGAREMIKYYRALRTNKSVGPYICKLVDFQAFTAAMLLLLNLCGYSAHQRGVTTHPPDLEQDQRDSDLIDETIALLHEASKELGGVVPAQSAQALEMLAQVRQGVPNEKLEECKNSNVQVSIPYFGTITIGIGKQFVPIKPGTFKGPSMKTAITCQAAPTGLPTPPSVTSHSAQPSPMSSTIDNVIPPRRPEYQNTDFIAPGLDQPWTGDDSFVTFDSFMPLPSQTMDFPTTSSGSDFASQSYSNPSPADPNMSGAGGYPFGNWPFNPSNVDLDQGWNWFGVDAPFQ